MDKLRLYSFDIVASKLVSVSSHPHFMTLPTCMINKAILTISILSILILLVIQTHRHVSLKRELCTYCASLQSVEYDGKEICDNVFLDKSGAENEGATCGMDWSLGARVHGCVRRCHGNCMHVEIMHVLRYRD